LNRWATGWTSATAPELPLHGQFHATLEPSYGLFRWWEIGGYFQTAYVPEVGYEFAGVKLRTKFVAPPDFKKYLRLGVNVELSYLPASFDRDHWGGEIRPILGYDDERWQFIVNPILGLGWSGQSFRQGPTFEPAVRVSRAFAGTFAIGVEYYGSIGPIASPLPGEQQTHQLFGVLDIEAFPNVEIDLGLGGGLTPTSAGVIGKMILGYTLDLPALMHRAK
jgi:hypothetical protein